MSAHTPAQTWVIECRSRWEHLGSEWYQFKTWRGRFGARLELDALRRINPSFSWRIVKAEGR